MTITPNQKAKMLHLEVAKFIPILTLEKVERAIAHAVNCKSLDADLNRPDYELGKLLGKETLEHILGITGSQLIEQMTDEEKQEMFGEPNRGEIDFSDVQPYDGGIL